MNVLLTCECQGLNPHCIKCQGHEQFEMTLTFCIPDQLEFKRIKFEPVAGLFQVFQSGEHIIGVGNIEFQPEERSYYIYEMQSFWGKEGYKIMIDTMRMDKDIDFLEGSFKWEVCSI